MTPPASGRPPRSGASGARSSTSSPSRSAAKAGARAATPSEQPANPPAAGEAAGTPPPGGSPLAGLPGLLGRDPTLAGLVGRRQAVLATPTPSQAIVLAALVGRSRRRPFLVATPTSGDAERLAHDLGQFLGPDQVERFPAWETLPFERVSPSVEAMGQRLKVLWRLADADRAPAVVVAPVRALLQRLGPGLDDVAPVVVRPGDRIDLEATVSRLVELGYRREYVVEHRGELAVRGSILDVFPATSDVPYRIDTWGDEVDRLTTFSVSDQRSTGEAERVEIHGCRELRPTPEVRAQAAALVGAEPWGREHWERLAEGQVFDGMESWLPWLAGDERLLVDLLGPDAQVVVVDPRRMRDRAADLLAEEADLATVLARTWGVTGASATAPAATTGAGAEAGDDSALPRLHLPFDRLLGGTEAGAWTLLTVADGPSTPVVEATGWDPMLGDPSRMIDRLRSLRASGAVVVLAADAAGSAAQISRLLAGAGLDVPVDESGDPAAVARPGIRVVVAPLEKGFVLPDAGIAVLSETDVTGRRRSRRSARPRTRDALGVVDDLAPGDYVVHHHHGVARYGGMVTRAIGGVERDYLLLEYKGGDRLYVPSDQIDAVRHYTGGESPTLHRLGGTDFAKSKARVRDAVRQIAQELVVLYQRRVSRPGHAYAPDSPWQRELEDAFAFVETPDQLRAIEEVKADMEAERPMDRLVCGDVGFGKTEVALRAVFKAVQDGKQAAVLVPTTLLAQQHFQTFSERFAGFPVRVEVLSRFLTAAQARKVVEGVAEGSVDVVIGTHRLLSGDIAFKDLGLLVVDEEQRFGVHHKEAIKQLKANVDVLTLTATPIPRTLEMSLTGIRDLSLLQTPPADRQPILTYVGEYDERAVAEAIRRELLREGQVFFVHNRVADIEAVAAEVRELVPEARIAVAHGQMDEVSLEQTVYDFWEGSYDVLVCTTIIESGIDMPTVNTLVVDRADLLGLGQLHQLRGRVGRAGQRAYAYLFHPVDRVLSEEAYERLRTISESTELGSGFRIAMRDLEIRGAGNLLGADQSGHIAAVGYDLYCQMVTEAVAELKGEEIRPPAEVKLDVPLDAYLPADYVGKEDLRLEAYRRLAGVTTAAEVDDIAAEWADRYGPVPEPAAALLEVARLRAECHRTGVREVVVTPNPGPGRFRLIARISPLTLTASQQVRLRRLSRQALYKEPVKQLQLPLEKPEGSGAAITSFLSELIPVGKEAVAAAG